MAFWGWVMLVCWAEGFGGCWGVALPCAWVRVSVIWAFEGGVGGLWLGFVGV